MAVSTIYAPSQQPGNNVATAFIFNFKILAKSDLVVYRIDALGVQSAALVLDVDYSVAFDPIAENGTVTFLTGAPVTGGFALIARSSNKTQGTVYPRDGSMPAKATETAVDKLTMIAQELLVTGNGTETPVEMSGLYANRPVAPLIPTYYLSTDRGSYEKWVPAAARWFLLG